MPRSFPFALLLTLCSLAARADGTDIWKSEGAPPRVSCAFAERMSAKSLYELLGEPFVVADSEAGGCRARSGQPVAAEGPVIGAPGIDPIGPRCKCPESYIAALQARIESLPPAQAPGSAPLAPESPFERAPGELPRVLTPEQLEILDLQRELRMRELRNLQQGSPGTGLGSGPSP